MITQQKINISLFIKFAVNESLKMIKEKNLRVTKTSPILRSMFKTVYVKLTL